MNLDDDDDDNDKVEGGGEETFIEPDPVLSISYKLFHLQQLSEVGNIITSILFMRDQTVAS